MKKYPILAFSLLIVTSCNNDTIKEKLPINQTSLEAADLKGMIYTKRSTIYDNVQIAENGEVNILDTKEEYATKYTYNKAGMLIEEEFIEQGHGFRKTTYSYDSEHNREIAQFINMDNNWEPSNKGTQHFIDDHTSVKTIFPDKLLIESGFESLLDTLIETLYQPTQQKTIYTQTTYRGKLLDSLVINTHETKKGDTSISVNEHYYYTTDTSYTQKFAATAIVLEKDKHENPTKTLNLQKGTDTTYTFVTVSKYEYYQ